MNIAWLHMTSGYQLSTNQYVKKDLESLFHRPEFFKLHCTEEGHYFEWSNGENVAGCIHFTNVGTGLWRSPARGTYGGFLFFNELKVEEQFHFYEAMEQAVLANGAQELEVLLAPMSHDPIGFSNQFYLLYAKGFIVSQCDLNHSLDVDSRSLKERMSYGNQKRLKKCERENLRAEQLALHVLPEVYDALSANRSAKGYSMSMSLEQLGSMIEAFPDAVLLFGSWDKDLLAAAALCLRVSETVLYVFYWGDRPGYSSTSPVVSVADAIYSYCQENQIMKLDIGTSTVDSEPNFGLIQFKRGLGFTESLKIRMRKSL